MTSPETKSSYPRPPQSLNPSSMGIPDTYGRDLCCGADDGERKKSAARIEGGARGNGGGSQERERRGGKGDEGPTPIRTL